MKSKKLATLLFTIILVLGLLPMSAFAAQRIVAADSTASITVGNALENDTLAAYKVVDLTYDAATNTLNYAWNSDFADYFAGTTPYNSTAYTVEQFDTLDDDSDELKTLLAGLPNYISAKNIVPVDTQTVAVYGAATFATFADLAMGEYFIRPTSTTSVYQLMLQKVEPTVSAGAYVIDDVTFSAKHKEVSVTKIADKTSVTKNEKVTYTITVDIPTYASQAVDKSFYVSDLLPDGLTIDTASIKVQIDGTDVDTEAYTLDKTANTTTEPYYTFKLSVDTVKYTANWSANGGKQLVITYTATLNNNDTTAVNVKETNTVTFDYSFYPYVENSHEQKTATVDVTTFAIKIDKHVNGAEGAKLANAKFDLYRTATAEEIAAGSSVTIPHTTVAGILLESGLTTNDSGVATFEKYEANDTRYAYYLVETKAPTGYNLLSNAVEVHFTDAEVAGTNGIYTVEIENTSGIQLPITGGTGTVIFTIIGIALMVGAVVLFVVSRKKAKESK